MTTPQPTQLDLRDPDTLVIQWSDGRRRVYNVTDLRLECPCASCNTERSRAGIGRGQPLPQGAPVTIRHMAPVGNYAYAIHFSDGHNTGIYPLDFLLSLGSDDAPSPRP